MQLSIRTEGLTFICAGEADADLDYNTGRPKVDANGTPIYTIKTLIMAGTDADVLRVKVPGRPNGVTPGQPVRVTDFTAAPYDINGKAGVTYRVTAMEPAAPAPVPAKADKTGGAS